MIRDNGPSVPFVKMHGSGNDFVLIDNRELQLPQAMMALWAQKICAPAFGIGSDGLIFLQNTPQGVEADYIWHFYNADGSRAEMCGNGTRCATRLGYELGLGEKEHTLGTDAGPIRTKVNPLENKVKVQLTPPEGLEMNIPLEIEGKEYTAHFVNTGVPHAVILLDDVSDIDVKRLGKAVREHERFAPAGTNANFASVRSSCKMMLRTYERGVEDETFACGTGAAATALVANKLGLVEDSVELTTSGGEVLQIYLENGTIFLEGMAVKTYAGEMYLDSLGLELP